MEKILSLLLILQLIFRIPGFSQEKPSWYLGQEPPGDTPEIFAPGMVSIEDKNTHALVISPDGMTMLFSRYPDRTSYILNFENGEWTGPKEAFFFGKECSFSSDGNKIFYYTEGDIFYVEKTQEGWSEPVRMGPSINTSQVEFYPCITADGSLYFCRDGNWKTGRIMVARFNNGVYEEPVDLGLPVNNGGAIHAWISPDESYLLFNSPREGSHTQNDIWVSFRNPDGSWSEPMNAGEKINSGADAILCPTVSPDGQYLFFTKLNFKPPKGYVYWVQTDFLEGLRKSVTSNSK